MKKYYLIYFLLFTVHYSLFTNCVFSQEPEYCPDKGSYWNLEDALKEPEKVISLNLSLHKLTELPVEIEKFINLECLDVSYNDFTDFPVQITKLKKLRYLKMSGLTKLEYLPRILKRIPSLKVIELSEYPLWKDYQYDDAERFLPNVTFIRDDKFQR
jgi:hypothetical protein